MGTEAKRKSRAIRENAARTDERRSLWAMPICQKDESEAAIETRIKARPTNTAVATRSSNSENAPIMRTRLLLVVEERDDTDIGRCQLRVRPPGTDLKQAQCSSVG